MSPFANDNLDKQYTNLIEELRCMVCQNQNLAESEAPLAVDMKEKIREMLEMGKTEREIKVFLLRDIAPIFSMNLQLTLKTLFYGSAHLFLF